MIGTHLGIEDLFASQPERLVGFWNSLYNKPGAPSLVYVTITSRYFDTAIRGICNHFGG